MNFSFKRFIPKAMQDTKWGSLTEVWQSIYTDIRDDKVKAIFNQYDFDNATEQELRDLAVMLGYNLRTLNGYTSTLDFIKKELLFLIPRLKSKTTPSCYQIQGIPFNLISNGYSVVYDTIYDVYIGDETLLGSSQAGTTHLDREDRGYTYRGSLVRLDAYISLDYTPPFALDTTERVSTGTYSELNPSYLDFVEFPSLDGSAILFSLTRNMIFNYTHKFIESATEFQSLETLKVLKNDIDQFKRVTDRCYYEPYLQIELNSNNTVTNKTWTDYQGLTPTLQKSVLTSTDFTNMKYINFGSGTHSIIHSGITDVHDFIFQISYTSGVSKITEELDHLNFRTLIKEQQHFSGFTEVAILDSFSGCLLYSTFPKVQWDNSTYSNIKFDFQII